MSKPTIEECIEWRKVVGNDRYLVSNKGDVKGPRGNILKQQIRMQPYLGYKTVGIWSGGKRSHCHVHRLVASAFIRPPLHGEVVNHINNIPDDNRVENLEWTTIAGNNKHMVLCGRQVRGDASPSRKHPEKLARGVKNGNARMNEEKVMALRVKHREGLSTPLLAKMFGVHKSTAWQIAAGKTWKECDGCER